MSKKSKSDSNTIGNSSGTISQNKKARFQYHIIETFEAGIMLTGAEIKSIRQGGISLQESYVNSKRGELYLVGAHIKPYAFNADQTYDPVRPRKLLLHKREIDKLRGRSEQKGLTIVPLRLYINKRGFAKVEIALGKGKAAPDKRDTIKERDLKREAERAMKSGK